MALSKSDEREILRDVCTRKSGWYSTRTGDKAARRFSRVKSKELAVNVSPRYIMRRRWHHARRRF